MHTSIRKLGRSSFLIVFCFQIFLQDAFAIDWSTLPPAIQMPDLKSDLQRLEFLQATQKAFPGIFEVAATYDIDPLQILKDQQSLVEKLAENPKYISSFQKRKLIQMRIHPEIPIRTEGTKITSKAIMSWKRQLIDALERLTPHLPLAQGIFKQLEKNLPTIKEKWLYEFEKSALKEQYKPLLKLGVKREYRNLFVTQVNPAKDIRSKLAIIQAKIPEYRTQASLALKKLEDFNLQYRNYLPAGYESAIEVEKEQIALAQLYFVLKKKIENFDHQDDSKGAFRYAKGILLRLSGDDLVYFSDPDVSDELTQELGTRLELDSLTERLKILVNKNIQYFSEQRRKYSTESKEDIQLQEVQPWIGVLRGLIGGDCASRFSFPYPNDPHEHVFLVTDPNGEMKGTVTTTIVDTVAPDGRIEKALYLITIAGKKIKPEDVELIFRAFEKNKEIFGVAHVLLPKKEIIPAMMNFPAIQGAYLHHMPIGVAPLVEIQYQDPDIRLIIQQHSSDYNTGKYDHMEQNRRGFILKLRPEDISDLVIQTQVKTEDPLKLVLTQLDSHEVIDFLLNQHASRRFETVDELLKSSEFAHEMRGPFIQATHYLANRPMSPAVYSENPLPYYLQSPAEMLSSSLLVAEFEAKAKTALLALGLTETQIAEKRGLYLYIEGRIQCPDAFSPENVEGTAELIARDLKLHFEQPQVVGWDFIGKQIDSLIHTVAFQPILAKITKDFQSEEDERAWFSSFLVMKYLLPQNQAFGDLHRQAVKVLMSAPLNLDMLTELRIQLTHPSTTSWTEEKLLLDEKINRQLRGLEHPDSCEFILYKPFSLLERFQKAQTPTNQEEMLEIKNKIILTTLDLIRDYNKPDLNPLISHLPRHFEVLDSLQPPLLVEEKEALYSYLENFFYESPCDHNFVLGTYTAIQNVKSRQLRTHLEKVHVTRLKKLMSENELRDSKIWVCFAQLFEKAHQTPDYHALSEDFRKIGTELLNRGMLLDHLILLSDHLEGPSGVFWPEAKAIVGRELQKKGGIDSVIIGLDSLESWSSAARVLLRDSSSPTTPHRRELLKKKFRELVLGLEGVPDLSQVDPYLNTKDWPEEVATLHHWRVEQSRSPKNIKDTIRLLDYWWMNYSDPKRRVYQEQLEEKLDFFLKNLREPEEWIAAISSGHATKYRPGKESRIELLRKKLIAILYSSDSVDHLKSMSDHIPADVDDLIRRTYPNIDDILSVTDPRERRNYLKKHYPLENYCTPEDIERLKELEGHLNVGEAFVRSE